MSWRTLAAWSIYPLMIFGGMAVAMILVDDVSPPLLIGLLGASTMLCAVVLERALPYEPDWNRSRGQLVPDALHLGVSSVGTSTLVDVTILTALGGAAAWITARTGWSTWPDAWPRIAQLALALVIGELGQYAAHRLLHRRAMWRIHVLHHSADRMYWLTANRNHPLDVLVQYSGLMIPLVVLGVGADVLALVGVFAAIHTPLQHSNIDLRTGPLDHVFSTATLHRWHHAPGAAADVNFGGNLSMWDHVFRTFHRPRDRRCTAVGLDGDPDFPRRYLDQLLVPVRWPPVR